MYTFGNNGNEAAEQMHFNGELKNDIWLDDCAAILNKQCDERQVKWMTRDGFWEESRVEITERVKGIIKKLEAGEKPYYQFTQSYEEMLLNIKEIHGKKAFTKIKSLIEK